jgi:hypothetical protein
MGWTTGVQFLAEARYLPLLNGVLTESETHSASYPVGTGDFVSVGKVKGRENSPPPTDDVSNSGAILPLPHRSPWHSA